MKRLSILAILLISLLVFAGCSSDNQSKMLKYNLTVKVKDVKGDLLPGATVTVSEISQITDENGLVQFKDLVSDTYTVTAKDGSYISSKQVTIQGADVTLPIQLTSEFYLYSSTLGSMATVQEWSGAATLEEISDGDYDKVFKVEAGTGWSSLAFADLSNRYYSDYESVTFKVKSDDLDEIIVKIPEVGSKCTIEDGEDLGNGWYEFTIPFTEFTGAVVDTTQFAFIADSNCGPDGVEAGDTFYITDVYFTPVSN